LGGVTVVDTPLVSRAMELARKHSEPFLFNHAVRSWLFAVRLGQLQGIPHDAEVVAVGSLLHDLGLNRISPPRHEAVLHGLGLPHRQDPARSCG